MRCRVEKVFPGNLFRGSSGKMSVEFYKTDDRVVIGYVYSVFR